MCVGAGDREVTAMTVGGGTPLVIGHTGFVRGPGVFCKQVFME